jgi:RNA polymerase sigma-54 factor
MPTGTVRLKELFSNGLNRMEADTEISTNTIKREIDILIKAEDKRNPLSDQDICGLLNRKNMNISRRTVAKYREELGIRPSSKRRLYA